MATDLENLKARYSAICAELAAMGQTKPGGLPNADATGIDHVGYRKSLLDELRELRRLIGDSEPFEVVSGGLNY
jgi:hypothetical protein